jgi:hypothetical protein
MRLRCRLFGHQWFQPVLLFGTPTRVWRTNCLRCDVHYAEDVQPLHRGGHSTASHARGQFDVDLRGKDSKPAAAYIGPDADTAPRPEDVRAVV